ncbi:MarR family winged helix-turn-helix transcriptional regulator [Streptomyces sp. t39]|uniref:MarR family winged helix-turn-helix transcriptional regulator n=1 Tax=Streptomyces sp. t39 TaxID=1828156 RepID=UPI0011CECFCA|nr:MarR family winged helix-turn-helix transcriptional regulator [Streptomyces sp. t39]TXS56132.1 MarR family transcriptional regulator [Streptomyces sp. t39]
MNANGDDGEAARSRPRDPRDPRDPRELLTRTALGVFRLNGHFVSVSDGIAREAGLTAARWQVLGAVVREPATVAGVARSMGITRQSVQRIADVLVAQGLAAYGDNPAHRRAKLLHATDAGQEAVRRLGPGHSALAHRLLEELGEREFAETVRVLERLSRAMDAIGTGSDREPDAD